MCGITLIYHADGQPVLAGQIEAMTRVLHHRGPDASATMLYTNAAIGHTRLSIVDVAGGAQPLLSACKRFAIVFNGEIYNYAELRKNLQSKGYQFSSRSDTEVLLQMYVMYGEKCLSALRGMYSFVVLDLEKDEIFIARDRLGIKPLVYHWNGTTLLAASEIKALFASGLLQPEMNAASIKNYFVYQFAIEPYTPFQNVTELPPGHFLLLRRGESPVVRAYWELEFPQHNEYENRDESYWARAFENAIEDAARSHLIGEVPIGAYLSGGIDSATTTWLLSRAYPKQVQSFSIHFSQSELDEAPIYRNIARHLKVKSNELYMDSHKPGGFLQDFVDAMYYLEQPQRMAVDVPFYLMSELVNKNQFKVIFSGEGADEIFGGYDCFRQDYMRLWGNEIKNQELRNLLYFTQFTQNFSMTQIKLLYELHSESRQQQVHDQFGCYPAWYDFWQFTAALLPGLFHPDFLAAASATDQMAEFAARMKPKMTGRHHLNQSLQFETRSRLPGWILWRSDRMSMAHGVEIRVPFLDHPLVELLARIPPELKLRGMNEKYLLKRFASQHLPKHPWGYKKQAFYTPIREWFFTPALNYQLQPFIGTEAICDAGIFDDHTVQRLRKNLLQQAQPGNWEENFILMQLEWVLMLVLSVQIIHWQFVQKNAACFVSQK